jgi:hypothetical protein
MSISLTLLLFLGGYWVWQFIVALGGKRQPAPPLSDAEAYFFTSDIGD